MASRDTKVEPPAIPVADVLALRTANAELLAKISELQNAFERFKSDTERRLTERSAEASPPVMVPLKSACSALDYERGRRLCTKGLVPSRRFGGRWLVDAAKLRAALAAHS